MDGAFVIHLGDFNNPDKTNCNEKEYKSMRNIVVNNSRIPVFFTNGSNDYINCPNPFQAFSYWAEYIGQIDSNWNANNHMNVKRMADHIENFSFIHKRVLFIGIDVVSGFVDTVTDANRRMKDNLWWVNKRIGKHYQEVNAVVLLGNEAANQNDNKDFFKILINEVINEVQIPTVYIHNSQNNWQLNKPFDSNYFTSLSIEGSTFPFMQVDVDPGGRLLFNYDQPSANSN